MVVGGGIPGRGNGTKAQSQESKGVWMEFWGVWVDEPGKVGVGQVVGLGKSDYGVWILFCLLWERLLEASPPPHPPLAEEYEIDWIKSIFL